MSAGAAGGAVAAAAAAVRRRREQEEEEMTSYQPQDLSGDWEFKILRSATGSFGNPKKLRRPWTRKPGRAGRWSKSLTTNGSGRSGPRAPGAGEARSASTEREQVSGTYRAQEQEIGSTRVARELDP